MTCRSLLPLAVLNAAVRRGLPLGALAIPAPKPFVAKARPREFRPGIDPAEFDKFVDELETEAVTLHPDLVGDGSGRRAAASPRRSGASRTAQRPCPPAGRGRGCRSATTSTDKIGMHGRVLASTIAQFFR